MKSLKELDACTEDVSIHLSVLGERESNEYIFGL